VNDLRRRVAAACAVTALLVLVGCDLWIAGVRDWWDRHSLTGSVVSNLLVLAVAGLIVDEVVARRQRRQRAVSVAVQGLIVYGQARRAYAAVTDGSVADLRSSGATDELRTLAGMLLTASPNLFDDPEARRFLDQVERFSVSLFRSISAAPGDTHSPQGVERLASEMAQLKATVEPLVARIPTEDRLVLEGSSQA
jgi:hypothetical protein